MVYTLKDDRTVEYAWVHSSLPPGSGLLLDVGSPQGYPTPAIAISLGYHVIAVDLAAQDTIGPGIEYRRGDLLTLNIKERFQWVLNISSVEHFGLQGRYGVTADDDDADLKAMERIRQLMMIGAKMLLTIPIGVDTVVHPLHRVYGILRLPRLLYSYHILREVYWGKRNDVDEYVAVDKEEALNTVVRCANPKSESAADHYYALGCFVLEVR